MTDIAPLWFEDPVPERALENYLAQRSTPYSRWKFRSVRLLIPRPSQMNLTALDYGCGGGEFAVWLARAGWRVTAVDTSPHSMAACRLNVERSGSSKQVQCIQNSAPDYWEPLAGKKFDLILAKDVIEHIEDDVAFLKRLKAILAPGGSVIIVTHNDASWNYWAQAPANLAADPTWCGWDETHVRFYNLPALKGKLFHAKLKPLKWRSSYLIPYRDWLWQGGLKGRFSRGLQKLDALSVFHMPEVIIGGLFPFNGLGWSIAVHCKHDDE
jgi:2-polyprenyl-6-hydroxyphenyl methylase/3-demethylubiquinone-9 3-methyltransferase